MQLATVIAALSLAFAYSQRAIANISQAGSQSAVAPRAAYEFSPDLLAGQLGNKVDISRFAHGNPQLAGKYRADVYVNDRWIARRDLRLAGHPAAICIDVDLLRILGVSRQGLTEQGIELLAPSGGTDDWTSSSTCRPVGALTRDASVNFDAGELRLDVTIPQASLARQPKGYVPPESWDKGITAAMLGYNVSAYRTSGSGMTADALFVGLNGGANFDRWRLRHSASYTQVSGSATRYTALGTFVSTDLPERQATFGFGDTHTSGQLLTPVRLRGISLSTDERMLPDSRRGYAPVIRGVANSNARVEVRQGNAVLYSTAVPPGPFEFNDLYPTGYGGDIQVIVIESDGTQRTTTVPFSSLPQLLRAGNLFYSVQAGQLLNYQRKYDLLQATVQYGLNNEVTIAGGLQAAERYSAALGGIALNTPIGAIQSNISASNFRRSAIARYSGWSLDASWAKVFPSTGTNLNFAAYRYSSRNFFGLDDAMRLRDFDAMLPLSSPLSFRMRNRAVLSINQALNGGLNFNLSANSQDFWDRRGRESGLQFGLYKQVGLAQLTVNVSSNRRAVDGGSRQAYTVGLSLPLGATASAHNNLSVLTTHDRSSGNTHQVGFYGNLGDRRPLSYGLAQQRKHNGDLLAANASYSGKYAVLGATASVGTGISQQSFQMSGGVVAADRHLVFTPFLGETIGLVRVEGAQGLRIATSQASELDGNGYTVLPYLSPYSANHVELNLDKAPLSARFDSTSAMSAPRAGAVVLLDFKRQPGYTLMLLARRVDGTAVPFGATVYDSRGSVVGTVAQAGRIEASADNLSGRLRVTWGERQADTCIIQYDLPKPVPGVDEILKAKVHCAPDTLPAPTTPVPSPENDRSAGAPGNRVAYVLTATDAAGRDLPAGAEIVGLEDPHRISVVAAGGRAIVRLPAGRGVVSALQARWIDDQGQLAQCTLVNAAQPNAAASLSAAGGSSITGADRPTPSATGAKAEHCEVRLSRLFPSDSSTGAATAVAEATP